MLLARSFVVEEDFEIIESIDFAVVDVVAMKVPIETDLRQTEAFLLLLLSFCDSKLLSITRACATANNHCCQARVSLLKAEVAD